MNDDLKPTDLTPTPDPTEAPPEKPRGAKPLTPLQRKFNAAILEMRSQMYDAKGVKVKDQPNRATRRKLIAIAKRLKLKLPENK